MDKQENAKQQEHGVYSKISSMVLAPVHNDAYLALSNESYNMASNGIMAKIAPVVRYGISNLIWDETNI